MTLQGASGISGNLISASGSNPNASSDQTSETVVWFSLDPRSGALVFYPREAARKLEEMYRAWSSGDAAAEAHLGDSFCGAIVSMNQDGVDEGPLAIQRTSRGRRDVQRFEILREGAQAVTVHGIRTHKGWRLTSGDEPGAEELSNDIPPDAALSLTAHQLGFPTLQGASSVGSAGYPSASVTFAHRAPRDLSVAKGSVALWEWCRHVTHNVDVLPNDAWGVYSQEINDEIETAYQAGTESLEIEVGVRKYEIIFGDAFGYPGTARQVDQVYRKKRHVRRRVVSEGEREERLRPVELQDDEAICAICCQGFAETRVMPLLKVRECGHTFHAACVQNLVDTGAPCPYCRGNVDWQSACLSQL